MKFIFFLAAITALALPLIPVSARANGDEVVVLYNSNLPESKALATYYAAKREVPRSQVWGFDVSTNEEISRLEFKNGLQKPLLERLEKENLWQFGAGTYVNTNGEKAQLNGMVTHSEIRYIVLCYGMPLKISQDSTVAGYREENMRPEMRRNEAAVDSELAALPLIKQDLPLNGPVRNLCYTATNAAALNPTNGLLMVARLDGPTAEIARGLVDKAIQAEKNGLWGRAYFDLRNIPDPGYKMGDDWIREASEACRFYGFDTLVDTNAATFSAGFPLDHIGFYCGWYDGDVSGPFTLPQVEFMPGAFAYHLHSFSAATLRSTTSHWVGPLLAKGATISMGCVYEPFLGATPEVGIFAARFIHQGFTFGEAAYACQNSLSWQTTVVGDPLYRPFGVPPQVRHQELLQEHNPLVEWSHLQIVNLGIAKRLPMRDAAAYLEQTDITRQSAILSEKLGDLCDLMGKPSSAITLYEKALSLDPSQQQRVRLRLTLGDNLSKAGRDEDAYIDYQKLIEEWPDYPGKLSVCEKLLTLANKLGRKDEAAKWNAQIKLLDPIPPAATSSPTPPKKSAPAPAPEPPPGRPVGPVGLPKFPH